VPSRPSGAAARRSRRREGLRRPLADDKVPFWRRSGIPRWKPRLDPPPGPPGSRCNYEDQPFTRRSLLDPIHHHHCGRKLRRRCSHGRSRTRASRTMCRCGTGRNAMTRRYLELVLPGFSRQASKRDGGNPCPGERDRTTSGGSTSSSRRTTVSTVSARCADCSESPEADTTFG
jgi:hypothetical protein